MKSKLLVVVSTLVMALGLMAQSATQTAPPQPGGDQSKTCACCNHDKVAGRMACCGKHAACCTKDADCCKDGNCCTGADGKSCPMMSKGKDGKMSCCADGKCGMAKDGKSCCDSKQCERQHATT